MPDEMRKLKTMKNNYGSRCLQGRDMVSGKSDSTREFKKFTQNHAFCPPKDL